MGKLAFVFPGQGSQVVGMGKDLFDQDDKARAIFQSADEILGESLTNLIFNGPQSELTLTYHAQPALLTTSYAFFEALTEEGIVPDYMAGHSLGEYTALAASGAFSFKEAVYTVRRRGEFMEAAVPHGQGAMAAILGMDRAALTDLTEEITANGDPVQLANINCPGQIVISGSTAGVGKASVEAKEKGAKRAIPLDVSGPFHSVLMEPAASMLKTVLDDIEVKDTNIPVISNVTSLPIYVANEIKEKLLEQLYSPVLWEDSVNKLLSLGVDTFIEVGPGKVLSGLIKKIDRSVTIHSVFDTQSLSKTIGILRGN